MSALYSLYRNNGASIEYTPPSLAGFGTQNGAYEWMDPTGSFNEILVSGGNIPQDFFRELSDVKSMAVHPSIKVVRGSV